MNHLLKSITLVFLLSFTSAQALSIVDIKGVMLQRISSFISWPQLPDSKMRICIVDDDSFAKHLQELYKNKKLHDLPLEVISIDSNIDKKTLQSCQIIYIANGYKILTKKISKILKNNNTLIIGSQADDINDGASIVIYPENNRFKILINKDRLESTELKADYRLLKLAKIVKQNGAD